MSRLLARVAGFAITTIALITSIHVGKQGSWGEALDGLGSGAWFTLPFAATAWLRSRIDGGRRSALQRTARGEFSMGLLFGALVWAVLWLGWTLPSLATWRPHAFAINSVAMALAGFVLPGAGRSRDTMNGLAEAGDPGDEPQATRADRG